MNKLLSNIDFFYIVVIFSIVRPFYMSETSYRKYVE